MVMNQGKIKFCPECGSELVDANTLVPSTRFMDELTERVAKRTADIFEERMRNANTTNADPSGKSEAGAADKSGNPEKTGGFFGRRK